MGAGGSALAALSPKAADNVHFYDAFLKMKLEKMSDDEIYNALKTKYVHNRKPTKTGRLMRNDSLQSVALLHFSQTLETNRIVFEKKKKVAIADLLEDPARANSCQIFPEQEFERVPLTALSNSNIILTQKDILFEYALYCQIAFYLTGFFISPVKYFIIVNIAVLMAIIDSLRGKSTITWQVVR